MTKNEIYRINNGRLAEKGKKYYYEDKVYIGNSKGTLDLFIDNKTSQSNTDKIREIESYIKVEGLNLYKEFLYDVDGNITNQNIYTDSGKSTLLYNIVYSYTGENISNIEVTRLSDSFTYNKLLSYDSSDNLTSINII